MTWPRHPFHDDMRAGVNGIASTSGLAGTCFDRPMFIALPCRFGPSLSTQGQPVLPVR
jgi:hypothetical protein